jgi:hypothetical protein
MVFVDPSGHYWVEDEEQEGPTAEFLQRFNIPASRHPGARKRIIGVEEDSPEPYSQFDYLFPDIKEPEYYWESTPEFEYRLLDPFVPTWESDFQNYFTGVEGMYDLILGPLMAISDVGYPFYSRAKGFMPFGGGYEFVIGASFQIIGDISRGVPLYKIQPRALIVGTEDLLIDYISTEFAGLAGMTMAGGATLDQVPLDEAPAAYISFFVSMDYISFNLTELVEAVNMEILFPKLNLEAP